MCHKKAGNEEGTRRARANLKDVHWCVTFVFRKLPLISPTPHCWILHESVCASRCMLLGVVAQTLKLVKRLSQQLPTFLLFRDRLSVAQHCWIPFAQLFQHCWGHARALHTVYKVLWVVSHPQCTAGPNIVGSCCIRLHTTTNTDATTLNIVGPIMLGVVVFVLVVVCKRM